MRLTEPVLDARELALVLWVGAVLVLFAMTRTGRESLGAILRTLMSIKLLAIFAATFGYGFLAVWLLEAATAWTPDLISETLFWLLGPGLVLLYRISTARPGTEGFFRTTLLEMLGVTVLIEFLINLYPFHLAIELALVPIAVLLGGMLVLAERPEHRKTKGCLEFVLVLIGLAMVAHTIAAIVREPDGFTTHNNLREFLLPVLLTLLFVPFLYLVGLYSAYDGAFTWIRFRTEGRRARWRGRLALMIELRGRTSVVRSFNAYWGSQVTEAPTPKKSLQAVRRFRVWERERRLAPVRERQRLERYAGVPGTDHEGHQLDQREFKATRDALHWLQTCQMGWYRNQGGRYRSDLLEVLESGFEQRGLPPDHGITLHVARNGKSWWAWRRTITGWCLGIGAKGPPPDEWLFDGPEPPSGPPGKDRAWSQWGATCNNW